MNAAQTYRGYRIECDPKPIPASCGVDWTFVHVDYDGPEDSRCGCAASADACREEIDWIEDEAAISKASPSLDGGQGQ
jgi:hypothetical protein